ncbi:MAG: hypothetical protein ACOYMG_07945 [Candidatus Methylumidiphilus sp.]
MNTQTPTPPQGHAVTCPFCRQMQEPEEVLDTLQRCFAAVDSLFSSMNENATIAHPDNLSALFGLLSNLQAAAVKANFQTIADLKKRADNHG